MSSVITRGMWDTRVTAPDRVNPSASRIEEARALPQQRVLAARPGARRGELPPELGGGDDGADRSPIVQPAQPRTPTPYGWAAVGGVRGWAEHKIAASDRVYPVINQLEEARVAVDESALARCAIL